MKPRFQSTLLVFCICMTLVAASTSTVLAAPQLTAVSQTYADTVIANGFDYIASQMNDDGGIRWTDESSNVSATIRVVLALASVNYPQDYLLSDSGNRPIDFLLEVGPDWIYNSDSGSPTLNVARAGHFLTAVAAANEDPHAVGDGSLDLVYLIQANYDPSTNIFGQAALDNVLDQVWAILGLAASNASIPAEAVDWLASAQLENGSWNDGWGSYLDTTPIALMALSASGHSSINSSEVQAAIAFMQSQQDFDGGWLTEYDTVTNADITGMMLQAIASLGQLPMEEVWQQHDGNPYTVLLNLHKEDGSIGGDFANTYSTADAILGLSGQPLYNLSYLRNVSLAFEYIFYAQESDGGWGDVGETIDVILALRSAGWDPETVVKGDSTPLDYLSNNLSSYIESGPDAIGKAILGIVAAGENPEDFADIDLVSSIMSTYDAENSAFGTADNTWHQALAILGLSAASAEIPQGAVHTLTSLQQEDGGWEYYTGLGAWPDSTALAVQALLATGMTVDDPVIHSGIENLQSQQTAEGDWGDSSTTAYVIMALNALGISPDSWKAASGKSPLPTLFSYQKSNGSFVDNWEYADDSMLSTTAALLAASSGDFLINLPVSSSTNYAGLVVDPGEEEAISVCITFEEDSLSGYELLEASSLEYNVQDGFLESILGMTNPEGETLYWSYWYFDGREWNFHNSGAGDSVVAAGAIDAWHFTSWETFPSRTPDVMPSLSEICGVEILKDYSTQPYLSYSDLFNNFVDSFQPAAPVEDSGFITVTEEPSLTKETTSESAEFETVTPETITSNLEEERSSLPVYIIISAGMILAAIIYIFVFRKKA